MKEIKIKEIPYPYVRVGTNYYKYIICPLASGDEVLKLIIWTAETIKNDYGKEYLLKNIPRFEGFCMVPAHIGFAEVVKKHLNKYEQIPFKPVKGNYSIISEFLTHIFQEQIEVGLDYLTILYRHPLEKLPVLCLVSKERNTGKTTFLNFLKLLFGANFTYNTNEDFRSNFNSHWSSKLIVAVDEVLLDKKEDSERIKNLSTAKCFKSESKGVDKIEVEIICKFILCSNNVTNFIHIEQGETRYWVREILPYKSKENENLLTEIEAQVPAFLHFLLQRELKYHKTTRMWFDFKTIETNALKRVIRNNKNKLEMQIILSIIELIDSVEIDDYYFCVKDIQFNLSKTTKGNIDNSAIMRVLKDEWKLKPNTNTSSYFTYKYSNEGFFVKHNDKGRYYSINRAWITENFDDLMT